MQKTFWVLFLLVGLHASPLTRTFPAYAYVFSEFDIDSGYAYDAEFEKYVAVHEKQMRRFYKKSLKRGEELTRVVRGALLDDGLSDLFLYVSMIESGMRTDAVSSQKAVGLWQFMPKTAAYYKLDVSSSVDERCDPFCATEAAIKHLEHLHEKFGKWYLAVMAYNCGEGRLQKAIARAQSDDLAILIDDDAKFLPKETRNYIRKILLLALIGESETVFEAPDDLKAVSPPPKMKDAAALTHLLSHRVKMGETLESVASEYGSSAAMIKRVNGLHSENLLLGQMLLIPVSRERFDTSLANMDRKRSSSGD